MMRTTYTSYFLTLFLGLCLGNATIAQTERVITLTVNTPEIDDQNINDQCTFGQPAEISNEDFTIEAAVGDTIVWQGYTEATGDQVLIESINHEGDRGGRDIFGQNTLQGEDGVVRGTILSTTEEGADYKYKITFRVIREGNNRRGVYHIDPKIRVR
jgi:hypothetical protein